MAATGTPTPNIGLRRAQGTDPASVDDINYNSALIDTKLGAVGNSSVQDQIDTLNGKLTTMIQTVLTNITSGTEKDIDLPSGFTIGNCIILSINLSSGSYVYSETELATASDLIIKARITSTNKIKIIPSGQYATGTIKVTLFKYK